MEAPLETRVKRAPPRRRGVKAPPPAGVMTAWKAAGPAPRGRRHTLVRTALALLAFVLLPGCIHRQQVGSLETLKTASEKFHQTLRWNDVRSAAQLVAPERRSEFLKARLTAKDDEDLKITEYELEDAVKIPPPPPVKGVTPPTPTANVISKITWYRVPSVTTKTDVVTTLWEDRDGTWVLVEIEGGPVALGKKAAPPPVDPAAPVPEAAPSPP